MWEQLLRVMVNRWSTRDGAHCIEYWEWCNHTIPWCSFAHSMPSTISYHGIAHSPSETSRLFNNLIISKSKYIIIPHIIQYQIFHFIKWQGYSNRPLLTERGLRGKFQSFLPNGTYISLLTNGAMSTWPTSRGVGLSQNFQISSAYSQNFRISTFSDIWQCYCTLESR